LIKAVSTPRPARILVIRAILAGTLCTDRLGYLAGGQGRAHFVVLSIGYAQLDYIKRGDKDGRKQPVRAAPPVA